MSEKLYFTRRGLEKLQKRISELTGKLDALQAQMAHVAEVGGNQYHDNASYELLVIDIRGLDYQLAQAHQCLNRALLVDLPKNADRVALGVCVTILRDGEKATWEIAGYGESDLDQQLLAYNTPLASLIMGRCRGDVVERIISSKRTVIEILEISIGGGDEGAK